MTLLQASEIERFEREFANGVSARQVVELFSSRGVLLSEATFRKYVQVGLLPRSRRVGRKGKHQGSQGVYPVETIRRVNAIKGMMETGLTIDQIKSSFVGYASQLEGAERELMAVLSSYEARVQEDPQHAKQRAALLKDARKLKGDTKTLIQSAAPSGSAVTAKSKQALELLTR